MLSDGHSKLINLTYLLEFFGDEYGAVFIGLIVGALFGVFGQRSRFCLRSAVIQFSRGRVGGKVAIWLFAFSAALVCTQGLITINFLDVSEARQLATGGSLSGALLGGGVFGIGMILTRGCSSRLLILSANGNLRALLSGLIFAVSAQATLHGVLSPLRVYFTQIWMINGNDNDLFNQFDLSNTVGIYVGGLCFIVAVYYAYRSRISFLSGISGIGVGLSVAVAWVFTYNLSMQTFEGASVQGISLTGPSADILMFVISPAVENIDFDMGLLPGIFLGSFLAAFFAKELKLEGFQGGHSMRRYIIGAIFMGFGGMLAGGCAVGAGITGGAIFATTAWVALTSMWFGAAVCDYMLDRPDGEKDRHPVSIPNDPSRLSQP